ncbi:unnamed protein product, partial [Sphacelaria rigidula]
VGEAEDALRLVDRPGTVVELANNPWIMPPEAVVEAGLPATKEYLLDVQMAKNAGADVTSLKLLKVVLVGSASAGKTSLMQSIIERRGSPTKGTRADASTVGVELCPHQLEDTEVEFFDCAGQVDYAGMHQTFLTRRALYLLVVDITKYSVEILDEVIQEDIMRWLYYLYLRAPGSTVILVANKCDGSIDDYTDTVRSVQNRVLELLKDWHEDRGLRGQSKGRVTDVNILPDMSRVSCDDKGFPEASGIPALIALLLNQAATSICVPPAWDFALEAIKCLRASRDPIWAAREKLGLSNTPPTEGVGNLHASPFISKNELSRKWELVVETVRGNVPAATVYNWESALNGALWISDFAGHTLRIDGGDGIFLDVLWLSKVLNPIVSHKTKHHRFNHEVLPMKRKLVEDNILQPEFALHLWGMDIDRKTLPPEEVKRALFRILAKLGVALPLGCAAHEDRNGPRDMLVIMRLEEKCDSDKHRLFEQSLAKNRLPCDREVMLKWEFDRAGAPQGLVERLIASCHVLGEVDSKVCWRYGAVFKSHFKESSAEGKRSLFTVALSMASYSGPEREFTARVVGPLANARVWAAIRYVASVMLTLSKEWPGVLWEAWPVCTEGHAKTVYLASSVRINNLGDLLLPAAAPNAGREEWCECLLESRGVLAQVREKLGVVIDTGKGVD